MKGIKTQLIHPYLDDGNAMHTDELNPEELKKQTETFNHLQVNILKVNVSTKQHIMIQPS